MLSHPTVNEGFILMILKLLKDTTGEQFEKKNNSVELDFYAD